MFREEARLHRGKPTKDEDGTYICKGRRGHVYEYDDGVYGLYYTGTAREWGFTKRRAVELGFTVFQDGDTEGTLLYDGKPSQWAWAFSRVRHTRRRRLTAVRRAALRAQMQKINEERYDGE